MIGTRGRSTTRNCLCHIYSCLRQHTVKPDEQWYLQAPSDSDSVVSDDNRMAIFTFMKYILLEVGSRVFLIAFSASSDCMNPLYLLNVSRTPRSLVTQPRHVMDASWVSHEIHSHELHTYYESPWLTHENPRIHAAHDYKSLLQSTANRP